MTRPVTIVVQNQGDHPDDIGVYVALLPPGGTSNPGGCTPDQVLNWVSYATGGTDSFLAAVPTGGRVTLKADVTWMCTNPSAVDGMNWTIKAMADHGADDAAACDTFAEVFDGVCESALADDDPPLGGNNTVSRALPIVRFVP